MILVEGLFSDGWTKLPSSHSRAREHHGSPEILRRLDLIYVTGHQLDVRVTKCPATLIVQCHPAHDLQRIAFWRRDCVVAGFPIHATRHVAEFRCCGARSIRLQLPGQRGLEHRVVGQRRKERLARKGKLQLPVYFNDWLLSAALRVRGLLLVILLPIGSKSGVMWHIPAADDFALHWSR